MSSIMKGLLNEVDPRNFDSDIDYYNALNKPRRSRSEDDYVEPQDDEPIKFQQKPDARPQYSISKDEDRQAGYNMTLTVKAPTTQKAQWAAESYVDSEWGAKKQIGDIQTVADGVVQVHMIDNHKHGYWKPWADEPPISKGIEFNESAIIDEANKLLEGLSPESRTSVINELSNELLGRYKKAAGADASAADKKGDYERGNKRFKGIVKATKKEFDNDANGVEEAYIFKGGFPFDVDHMPGSVIRNRNETTDVIKTKNKDKWDDEVDRINDEVFDDMSEFRTDRHGETVTGNSAVWAKWDNRTQTGWINRKGHPLKPWPVKEQGVEEGYDKWGWHTSLTNGEFMPTKYGNKNYVYLHDLDNESPRGGPQLVTVNKPTVAKRIAKQFGGKVVKTDLNTYRIVKPAEQGLEEDLSLGESFDMKINELMVNEDWQKVNKKDKTDGMSSKAVKAYRRENPGSKLKTAVTTKPSKLKKGSKAAKRRKSFCARMSGMKKAHASAKTKRDPDSPINKALRRWNCESVEQMQELIMIAESKIAEAKNAKQQAAIAIAKKAKKGG